MENGAEAVEAAGAGGFDLILMDIQMPVMDGLTAIRRIRADAEARGVTPPAPPDPVLSANADPQDVSRSEAAGAEGHLGKPINAASLLATIAEALGAAASLAPGAQGRAQSRG